MNNNKILKILVTISWSFFIFILLTMPLPVYELDNKITFHDKGIHIVLFGILAYLIIDIWQNIKKHSIIKIYFYSFVMVFIYSYLLEYIQQFVPGRDESFFDLIAGVLGIFVAIIYDYVMKNKIKPKLLLHICCIGCGIYACEELSKNYKVILYFNNPNIFPKKEYLKRLKETEKIAKQFNLEIIKGKYSHFRWKKLIKGHESDPERGERCKICYHNRILSLVKLAKKNNIKYISTTLTTSPHKDAKIILEIGRELGNKYGIIFIEKDFKKNDGFKKSAEISKKLNLYRQNYCGCEFSRR